MNERPRVSRSTRKRAPPSTTMLSRPSSKRSSTSDDARERPDLAHAFLVGVDQPELAVRLEALLDQLAVARLEDVERHALGGKQHDPEREEADLLHRG